MLLEQRVELLEKLAQYLEKNEEPWQNAKELAFQKNGWFIPEFINLAVQNISTEFLQKNKLENFVKKYAINANIQPKKVGIIMAGNIPLVGFHDFLCGFLSGHNLLIKLSEKDDVLLKHLVQYLASQNEEVNELVQFSDMLKNCDAYIATGSNNSARYFEHYFNKYPNIIRKNRTSIAVLIGTETIHELEKLADDVFLYFGLGCRNVTKIIVPKDYDFIPLLTAFKKYEPFKDNNKYKNNYDYNLSIHILNKVYYMSNENILLVEDERYFSPISQLNYSFYTNEMELQNQLKNIDEIQCIVGKNFTPFGEAQVPKIDQFADGVDTMEFLKNL